MRRTGRLVVVAAVVALLAPIPTPTPAPARTRDLPATGVVPDELAARYLARRPPLGAVTVVDISGETSDRRLLAATLQGVVNQTEARIYLVGARTPREDQLWLDDYRSRGLISVAETVDLDTAIVRFASELGGYVTASTAEPWTINTATTVAGVERAVVVTPSTEAVAVAAGLSEVADHVGRWTDAATAYEDTASAYRDRLGQQGVAIQQPDRHQPRDLYVQQGVAVLYTRPAQADFDRVYDLIETFPAEHPVYGYVSDTGAEEVQAVARLSFDDRYLVPTDTTDNLSFHVAVGGDRRALPAAPPTDVEPCDEAVVNVVIAMSDGDNMVIPEVYYPRDDRWGDPRRGELPVGWGLSPAAAVLMPAIWDRYVSEATAADEIVDIMGLGYSFGSVMPGAVDFLTDGSRLRAALGIEAHWSLDALLSQPDAAGWSAVSEAGRRSGDLPAGMLLNYGRWPGPAWFRTTDDVPVLASRQQSYDDGPDGLAAQVQALVDAPEADRPLVSFFSATVWNASYSQLVDAMGPLADQGVRFLTPSEAFACLAPPDPHPVPTTDPQPTPTTDVDPAPTTTPEPVPTTDPEPVPTTAADPAGEPVADPGTTAPGPRPAATGAGAGGDPAPPATPVRAESVLTG